MIPRYQRLLFWILAGGILLTVLVLLHGCKQAHDKLTELNDATPIAAPTTAEEESFTFYLADDRDGSISLSDRTLALPQEPTTRARALLSRLLAEYSLPGSPHPIPSGPAIADVFLLAPPAATGDTLLGQPRTTTIYSVGVPLLAIVNLQGAFAANHPSGIEVEDLTIKSIVGTLHANLPEITEIRFLVDGQPRDTLAGHADLNRTYPAVDTARPPTPPQP